MKQTWRELLPFCLAPMLFGQAPGVVGHDGSSSAQLHSHAASARRVSLDVVVTDKTSLPAPGLQATDFQVTDNKKIVPLSQFHANSAADASMEVDLAIDAINLSHESLARARDQIQSYLARNGGRLTRPVSILILTDVDPKLKQEGRSGNSTVMALRQRQAFVRRIPASREGAKLATALEENADAFSRILEAQGGAGQSERVQLSLQALNFIATAATQQASRHIVIWIGPGWPLLAQTDARSKERLFDTIVYFSNLLRDARITLDMVNPDGIDGTGIADNGGLPPRQVVNGQAMVGGPMAVPTVPSGPTFYESFLRGVKTSKQADANDLALQVLAHQTGGLILQARNKVADEIARCVEESEGFYVLAYDLPAPGGVEQFHEVLVKVNRPNMEARTSTGFYAK